MSTFHPVNEDLEHYKLIVSLRVDNETLDKIDEISGKINISRNKFINQCIKYALDNLDPDEEKNKNNNNKKD